MKHSLGKIILFIVSFALLQAEDFSYKFHLDNIHPYVKEAVILTLDVNQTNHDIVLLFDFDIKQSDAYSFQRIGIEEIDAYHATQIRYTYLLYPLHSGDIIIDFTLTQKSTTDDSVAYSFSGDRDNIKGLVTKDTKIVLSSQILDVKPLPEGTLLVGDFTLDYTINKHKAKAYEALPFEVTIKGNGYPPMLHTIIPQDVNFTVFTEQPNIKNIADAKGSHSTVIYPMALSHGENFTLPKIALKAFNPKTQTTYTLSVPSQSFEIETVNKDTLIDKVDSPNMLTSDWSWVKTFLGYLVVFAAGYLTALSLKWQKKPKQKATHPLIKKIQDSKNTKMLLQLLMAHDTQRFSTLIEKLEDSLYGDGKISLKKVKEEAQDLL